jgi:hypothetical protein
MTGNIYKISGRKIKWLTQKEMLTQYKNGWQRMKWLVQH